jgi:hypothetical protein
MEGGVFRTIIFAAVLLAMASSAYAEVWMVKPAGAIGCRDRDAFSSANISDLKLPAGCVSLYAGERLLETSNSSGGFADYIHVQRADGSMLFVSSSLIALDPGIGSIEEDRPD